MGWVMDYGQFDRACQWCPDPSDCDLAGYCQLGDPSHDEYEDACSRCHGEGEIEINRSRVNDPQCAEPACCPECHGTGVTPESSEEQHSGDR